MDYKEAFIKYYESPSEGPLCGELNLATAIDELMQDRTGVVETGTFHGLTSRWFAQAYAYLPFYTIEIDPTRASAAKMAGLNALCGDSADILPTLLNRLGPRPLFFLDAHWGASWPLLKELEVASTTPEPVILVHDFDDGDSKFDPGNDLNGPVGIFMRRPSRFQLYHQAARGKIGVGMMSLPKDYMHWTKDPRLV